MVSLSLSLSPRGKAGKQGGDGMSDRGKGSPRRRRRRRLLESARVGGVGTNHRRPCPVEHVSTHAGPQGALAGEALGSQTPVQRCKRKGTYEQREGLLELGDLLLGERIGLQAGD